MIVLKKTQPINKKKKEKGKKNLVQNLKAY